MTEQSYHPGNLNLVPYPSEAVIELAEKAKVLGVLIHIEGLPFGDSEQSARTSPRDLGEADTGAE